MRKTTKEIALAMALVTALSLGTGVDADAASKVKVSSVKAVDKLTGKKTIKLAKGKTANIKTTVKVSPNKAANKKVTYKTSNKKVATVSSKGVIKAKKKGTAKITVVSKKNSKKKATIKVTVVSGKVTSVSLDKKTASIVEGATETLKATVKTKGSKANKTLKWTSSNEAVATVSSKGVVTAKKAGTATITVKSTDGTNKKATCTVTVTAPVPTKKTYTTVEVAANAKADVTVNFKDATKAESDVKALVSALALKSGDTKVVKVNNVDTTVVVKDGTLYVGDKLLSSVANNKKATIVIGTKASTAIKNLKALTYSQASDATVKIGTTVLSELKYDATKKVTTIKVNGTVVTVNSISNGVLTLEGNQTAVLKALIDARIATVKTIEK